MSVSVFCREFALLVNKLPKRGMSPNTGTFHFFMECQLPRPEARPIRLERNCADTSLDYQSR